MFVTEALDGDAEALTPELADRWQAGPAVSRRLRRGEAAGRHPGDEVQPEEFLEQLEAEHRIKPEVRESRSIGFLYRQLNQGGVSAGYGMETASVRSSPPRDIRIALVEPGSPAAAAGILRGAKILAIDGVNVVSATGTANVNVINGALSPKALQESHTFTFDMNGTQSTVLLTAQKITSTPVQNVKVIDPGGANVGYLLFNDHITTSEPLLINAVNTFKGAGIKDLVLDMRYNGGGQLAIASRLAYMISSPGVTAGKTFEQLVYNDKNPFRQTVAQTLTPFLATSNSGQPLPTLGLSRVTVLTGPDTCSASESVINSLRGVGVAVNLVGGTTCGKPYGFIPQDNCGTTYFAIQFKGANQQGYGDYSDGFAPDPTAPWPTTSATSWATPPRPGWPQRSPSAARERARCRARPRLRRRGARQVAGRAPGRAALPARPLAAAREPPDRHPAEPGLRPLALPSRARRAARGKPLGHGPCHARGVRRRVG
jgi:hypothetical protein